MHELAIREAPGLGDGAGGGEGGGVGRWGSWIGATAWMARKVMR